LTPFLRIVRDGADCLNGGADTNNVSHASSVAGVAVNLNVRSAAGGAAGDRIVGFDTPPSAWHSMTRSCVGVSSNIIGGADGTDRICRRHGNDYIFCGAGNDPLRGRLGHDRIHFDTMLNAETDVDMITNFSVVDDVLMVVDGVFGAIGATGFFAASRFAIVAARENAETAHHHVVYEHSAGLAVLRRPRLGAARNRRSHK
jgi:serralysin